MTLESDVFTKEVLDEIQSLIKKELLSITSHCKSRSVSVKTPSDFTFPDLKLGEYNKLLEDNGVNDYDVQDIYNLTPLQEGFLFHSMMDGESSTYFEQISLDLSGNLDLRLFEEGWQHIAKRHDVLMTMFISDFRVPVQIVLKNRKIGFSSIDIRGKEDKENCIKEIKISDRSNTFNLRKDPLFRVGIVQYEDEKYTIILSFQHIILDGWCTSILFSEFMQCYTKLINNQTLSLDLPPVYSNYIKWLNNQGKEEGRDYWKSYLDGYEELASVPKDSVTGYSGEDEQLTHFFTIDAKQTDRISKLARELGVTLNTVIQSVWGIILSRYNGNDDVVFGSTVSGRPQDIDRIEQMVGLFINTIPVRIKIDKNKSFRDIAVDVQQEALESMNYHHSSLAQVQSDSDLGRGLLDHIIVFENYPIDDSVEGDGSYLFRIDNVDFFEQINYDFGITVIPSDCLSFRLSYNPGKYSGESIKRIQSHIEKTLDEIILNKNIKIKDLEIIPADEKNLLLNVFNDTKTDFPADKTIVDLFEEQVEKTPDNVAVVFEDVELTYRELNEKANIVGHYLRDNYEIEPDDLVGVLLERSEKMII
ncbi:MAG: AMP-binding protein, partial [Desulfobacteraceae bacterium]|nr:AMP-binding protein [Desulfobacteraceae bacterium]